jgi:hypothetical protein
MLTILHIRDFAIVRELNEFRAGHGAHRRPAQPSSSTPWRGLGDRADTR